MSVVAPCDWPHLECDCPALGKLATEGIAEVVAWASQLLWAATGKLFGPCDVSVLPCDDFGATCSGCWMGLRSCGCRSVPEIRLPGPVHSINEVVIDGVTLDDTAYRVEEWLFLVRTDGDPWPTGSDPLDPDGFRVDYKLGIEPPAGAGLITGILACELAKAVCGDDTCRLPARVRNITRQGISVGLGRNVLIDPNDLFGIPEINMWVETATLPMLAGAVHSPDLPMVRRVTWTAVVSPGSP